MSEIYTHEFFETVGPPAERAAKVMAPMILEAFPARSIVDVGCGNGAWLAAFAELGVKDYLGIDGDYVQMSDLKIAPEKFMAWDLTKPAKLDRMFDLATSLEVAEHLPPESAAGFVESLCGLASTVIFSGAIPGQRGGNHLNEQWPPYWIELFARNGYGVSDPFRKRVWGNKNVAFWYAQNLLVFKRGESARNPADLEGFSIVHPELYKVARGAEEYLRQYVDPETASFSRTVGMLPKTLANAIKRRVGKKSGISD